MCNKVPPPPTSVQLPVSRAAWPQLSPGHWPQDSQTGSHQPPGHPPLPGISSPSTWVYLCWSPSEPSGKNISEVLRCPTLLASRLSANAAKYNCLAFSAHNRIYLWSLSVEDLGIGIRIAKFKPRCLVRSVVATFLLHPGCFFMKTQKNVQFFFSSWYLLNLSNFLWRQNKH